MRETCAGCFNLDPNRVLDIILESMECRPEEHHFYTSLLKLFPCQSTTLTELLGFRMNACSNLQDQRPVFRCMALLVQSAVLTLQELYAWVSCFCRPPVHCYCVYCSLCSKVCYSKRIVISCICTIVNL